jgi:hypothetical protein
MSDTQKHDFPSENEVREWRRSLNEAHAEGVRFGWNAEGFNHIDRMANAERYYDELAAERAAQIEGAKAVLTPLATIASIATFALCFLKFNIGFLLSALAAVLTFAGIGLLIGVPVGHVLGKRASQRLRAKLQRDGYH